MPAWRPMPVPLSAIQEAARRLQPHLHRTPVFTSRSLGERAGVSLHLKAESFQKTGSFKPRGALNIVLTLPEARRARGLITVSAGNHAQAVAWAARVARAGGRGMRPALGAGRPVPVQRPSPRADGPPPPFVGALPLEAARRHVDELVMVEERDIADAMRALFERARLVVEGAGAAATAALLARRVRLPERSRVAAIVSRGNRDAERLAAPSAPAEARRRR